MAAEKSHTGQRNTNEVSEEDCEWRGREGEEERERLTTQRNSNWLCIRYSTAYCPVTNVPSSVTRCYTAAERWIEVDVRE
jgi:hypothetical protein